MRRRWPAALAVIAVAVPGPALVAGVAWATPVAVSSASRAFPVTASPCEPAPDGACTEDPSSLSVPPGVTGVEVTWEPGAGRPARAPSPASPLAGSTCSDGQCPWPGAEAYDGWTLNGTYQVTCTAAYLGCSDGPGTVEIAVAPSPPTHVKAEVSPSGAVLVSWSPPANPAPDLSGYEVSRSSTIVFSCSTDGSGQTCPSPLAGTDHPPAGAWTYTVRALRLGVNSEPSSEVESTPAAAPSAVTEPEAATTQPPTTAATTRGPASVSLPPVPIVGVAGAATTAPAGTRPAAGRSAASASTTTGGSNENLPYARGSPTSRGALGPEPGPRRSDVDLWAAVGLAVIALALAVHAWYLREELGNFSRGSRRPSPRHKVSGKQRGPKT